MADTRLIVRNHIRQKLAAWPLAKTTLNGAVSNTTVATVTLTSIVGVAARCLLQIDTEIMRVISISGNVATVMRGDQGSTAATHSNGADVIVWPFFGWTDLNLNDKIDEAIDWLADCGVWSLVPKTNTFLSGYRDFGAPDGCDYPNGNIIKKIEVQLEDDTYREFLGWEHLGDRIYLNKTLTEDIAVRLWVEQKQARLTSDSSQLDNERYTPALTHAAVGRCLEELVANRSRFIEYSAALNDRAADPDILQRQAYYFFNQATIAADKISRPGLSGRARIVPLC